VRLLGDPDGSAPLTRVGPGVAARAAGQGRARLREAVAAVSGSRFAPRGSGDKAAQAARWAAETSAFGSEGVIVEVPSVDLGSRFVRVGRRVGCERGHYPEGDSAYRCTTESDPVKNWVCGQGQRLLGDEASGSRHAHLHRHLKGEGELQALAYAGWRHTQGNAADPFLQEPGSGRDYRRHRLLLWRKRRRRVPKLEQARNENCTCRDARVTLSQRWGSEREQATDEQRVR